MSSVDAARELLPAWVVWAPLLYLPAAFILAFLAATAGTAPALWRLRRAAGRPWPERARIAHVARSNARQITLLALLGQVGIGLLWRFPLCPVPAAAVTLAAGLAAYLGAALRGFCVERAIRQGRFTVGEWLRAVVLTWLLFNPWLLVLVVLAPLMPWTFTPEAWLLLGAGAVALTFFNVGGGLLVARAIGLVRPAGERLQDVVDRTSAAIGVPVRGAHELDYPAANAVAFILLRRLAFTPDILACMDDDELAAITAHELGHLAEPRLVALARFAPSFIVLVLAAGVPITNALGLTAFVGIAFASLVAAVLPLRLSRHLERRADRVAQEHQGLEGTYARALARLYEANLSPLVEPGRGTTHPHLYDRLVAAGAPPDFPRPRPPASGLRNWALIGTFVLLIGGWLGSVHLQYGAWWRRDGRSEAAVLGCLACGNRPAVHLGDLALVWWDDGRFADAALLYAAAGEIDPASPYYPANQAIALARVGRCDEAERAAREARRRLEARPGAEAAARVVGIAGQAAGACRDREGVAGRP